MALAMLGISYASTSFSWFPDKLDLVNGMALGAGFGAALGGAYGLLTVETGRVTAIGTIVGVVAGGAVVALGQLTDVFK